MVNADDLGAGQPAEVVRARLLVEESREAVVVLDAADRVVLASRRAREAYPDLAEGQPLPVALGREKRAAVSLEVPFEVAGNAERIVYLSRPGDLRAYEELRAGFTAAVSHELRTPLARLLALFESAELPGANLADLVEQARHEVAQMGELIDDVLFLGELETGHEVVGLGATPLMPIVQEVVDEYRERAELAGLSLRVAGDPAAKVDVRPRMLRVIVRNLIENAMRYAGPECALRLSVDVVDHHVRLAAVDTGVGVDEDALPRLFERFYRADTARASRGTGLGLAIVKHITVSAGGWVEAASPAGEGLTINCVFPLA
jgi:signal transduction histidine kinase